MSREIRMVPVDWEHPRKPDGQFIPLFDGDPAPLQSDWDSEAEQWDKGFSKDYSATPVWWKTREEDCSYAEWAGARPRNEDYMPNWPQEDRTHLMLYETTSEGTPKSPALPTVEELARWLADSGATVFADETLSYEEWLTFCQRGWAPTLAMTQNESMSGVKFLSNG